jgi:hypothetical protein
MSQPEDNLAKALAQNGSFDPERARQLKQKAVAGLNTKMRWVGRITFIFLCLDVWVLLFAFHCFLQARDTKLLLLYAFLMLICFESTVLIKLWYWVMNGKIGVLKEIKLLRLELPRDDAASVLEDAGKQRGWLRSLRWAERIFWWSLLIAGIVVVDVVTWPDIPPRWGLPKGTTLTRQACVTLAPDGSASVVTDVSCQYEGAGRRTGFSFHAPRSWAVRWIDSRGQELSATAAPLNDQHRYDVRLNKPVYPGQRYSYVTMADCPNAAVREGDVWTYSTDQTYGYGTNEYVERVVLPEGAEIVSATPWPAATFTLNNKRTVRFESKRGPNEPFQYTIQYRLPTDFSDSTER